MVLGFSSIIAFIIGIIALYALSVLLVVPVKIIIRLVINGIMGGLILLLVNLVGGLFGLSIGINPVTSIIAGFLGVPGVVLLLIIQMIT